MPLLGDASESQTQIFELAGLPVAWARLAALFALALVLWYVFWLYRREARAGAGARLRMSLATLRGLTLLGLAIVLLEPVIATYTQQITRATVIVLADASLSMSISDPGHSADDTRSARVARLLSEPAPAGWLARLASRNLCRVYTFGEALTETAAASPAATDSGPAAARLPALMDALRPVQGATDLSQALTQVLEDIGDQPLAGVVILTDGGINRGAQPTDIVALARRSRATLYCVGLGDPEEPPNLRVSGLVAPLTTPLGDPLEIRVDLAAEGVVAATATLELRMQRSGGTESTRVAQRVVNVDGPHWRSSVQMTVPTDAAGEFTLSARLLPLPEEAVTFDNERTSTVLVVDERLKVLIVAGRPSFDYRFMTRLFERDKSIDVSCWLQSADARALRDGDVVLSELPRKPEDLLQYDVVLLLDPDPRELDESWALAVRRLVDELGGGLLLQAGPHFTASLLDDARLSELVGILPISRDAEAAVRLNAQGAYRQVARSMELTEGAAAHPLIQLGMDAAASTPAWDALSGVYWHFPVLREKPLATVLLRLSDRALGNQFGLPVLLAVQPVGTGRAMFLGFDGLWRWRASNETLFNRFCVQTVRYLSQARRQAGSRRGSIQVDRETPTVGDFVKIEARVLDENFGPWPEPRVVAQVSAPGGAQTELLLEALPAREGWFGGRLRLDTPGPQTIRVPLPGTPDESLVKALQVQPPDLELRSLRQHTENLELLASETGGRYLPFAEAASLPELIDDATVIRPRVPGPRTELWDRPWVLAVLAGLLTTEWALRRRHHLL